ncbi:hypothetical protein J6590_058328 [Homalodisca vitripennis]|nr:hypothetical protein J6590_058328 [Homalodisca vitripennis]
MVINELSVEVEGAGGENEDVRRWSVRKVNWNRFKESGGRSHTKDDRNRRKIPVVVRQSGRDEEKDEVGAAKLEKKEDRREKEGIPGSEKKVRGMEAIRDVAAEIPWDLLVQVRVGVRLDVEGGADRIEAEIRRREECLDKWKERWRTSEKGRETYPFWMDARMRIEPKIKVDHYTTQFLT